MGPRSRDMAVPAGLSALAFALALAQAPGRTSFDTKVHLHVDPVGFLGEVASAWSPTTDLGHVQGGQYSGYLWPMGPFFALGRLAGLPDWLVHRLWLGAVLALAAWGTVRLLDALLSPRRGVAHVVAGAAMVLNPYVVTLANRASVTLLAYALLPWLVLAAHRALRAPRGWWWPAAFALLVASSAAGVNAAVVAWVLLAPVLLALFEALAGWVAWRAVWAVVWRTAALGALTSLWWVAPILVQAAYGTPFLAFIEQPGTIWGTTSASEALRLMGYWISYTGVGFTDRPLPLLGTSATLLFVWPVVVASLLVPGLAVLASAWTRRWRHGPFFVLLVLAGVLAVVAGFPEGTPLRQGLHFTYNRVDAVQFLRTSHKAAPLVALGVAVLLGAGAAAAARRVPRGALAVPAAALVLLALSAWPLVQGRAVGLLSDGVPAAWREAGADLDRDLAPGTRAVVAPGQLFAFHRWGGTVDPILPLLTERPVAVRQIVPYADLRAVDLLWTVDALVTQERLYPGQLRPLLSLMGAGALLTGSDDDRARSGSVHPYEAAAELAGQGLGPGGRAYGPVRTVRPPADELGPPVRLAQVRRHDLPGARGMVRVQPLAAAAVVDGSAETLAGLAALGSLPSGTLRYAADLDAAALRAAAAAGSEVVVGDSNRRRVFVNSRPRQALGHVEAAEAPFSEDASVLDPFAARGSDAQTVAVLDGARAIRAPYSPGLALFPEHRPYAAFDGDPGTSWLADRALEPARRWIEVDFEAPRDVPWVEVVPADDARGVVREVEVGGRRFAVRPGANRLALGLRGVRSLRVRITRVDFPPEVNGGAGGFAEVRVPGLRVTEALRVPRLAERALAGADLHRTPLAYVLARTTGDEPLRRSRRTGPPQARSVRDRGDAETGLRRLLTPPAARRWTADAWLSLSPEAPDAWIDRLAGWRGAARATSSGRFENRAAHRASSAFDGRGDRAWVGEWVGGRPAWLAWETPAPRTLRRLRLVPSSLPVRRPAVVRLRWGAGAAAATTPLPVAADGTVVLPRAVRARAFRLEVLATRLPPGADAATRRRRAVGVAELRGAGVPRIAPPRAGALPRACGATTVRASGRRLALRLDATVADLEGTGALRARSCGTLALPAGRALLEVPDGPLRADWLRLRSAAPAGAPRPAPGPGRVTDPGDLAESRLDGARVALDAPGLLVLGQSFNRGWRATCDGRDLGEPEPVDGHANGWRAPADCRDAAFVFAPDRTSRTAGLVSGAACLLLLALLLVRRRPAAVPPDPALLPEDAPAPWPWRRAVAAGVAAGVVLGFVFAIRAGVVIAPLVALALRRGVPGRHLALAAGALLVVVVPVLYVAVDVPNRGGYNFNYPVELISAHWVAVAALVLLLGSLARSLAALSAARARRAGPPA